MKILSSLKAGSVKVTVKIMGAKSLTDVL